MTNKFNADEALAMYKSGAHPRVIAEHFGVSTREFYSSLRLSKSAKIMDQIRLDWVGDVLQEMSLYDMQAFLSDVAQYGIRHAADLRMVAS